MTAMLRNWYTTILGILAGAIAYLQANGAELPQDAHGWLALLGAALLAGLGLAAKDATTGSPPR